MSNYLLPRLPVSFFQHHSRAANLIMDLCDGYNREEVLMQLNDFIRRPRSESMRINLGYHLWNSFDREVLAAETKFLDSTLTPEESSHVCNALTFIASHPDARSGSSKENPQIPGMLYRLAVNLNLINPQQLLDRMRIDYSR
ncbi:hypothetical protein H5410_028283 [Solanum commersonii]|uniref:Uncharacterized protein n=1 Tax=Solanum commersonii TaxID=4109 RepID=A0A9J5Z4H1_SOLCO|nr:hypothetical protein H5410_028283 [Solanum commersonii]